MARSPLFSLLRRLARRVHVASALGTTPADLERAVAASPTRRQPSRRQFLGTVGAAAALVPIAAACGDNSNPPVAPTIAIIGGGVAGMACAHFLSTAGVIANVYEASMRIGGRMYTTTGNLQGGQICELGGELIDSDHVIIPALARTFGLTVDDLVAATDGLTQQVFFFGGVALDQATIEAAFTPVAAAMANAITATSADADEYTRIDNMSISDWLVDEAGLATTDMIYTLLCISYLEEFGLEVDQQSAFNLLTLIDYTTLDPFSVFGVSDERYHIHQGSNSIPQAIADSIPEQVFVDHALTAVATDGTRFTLTFASAGGDTTTVTADHVVYALPFTKLREVSLAGAGLSDMKNTIIQTLGYGSNSKLMMQFTSRTWETNQQAGGYCITDVGQLQTTWATSRGQAGAMGVMTDFVGGNQGVAIGDDTAENQAVNNVLPWLDQVFPGAQAAYIPGTATRQHWPSYPFNKASYACYLKGQWAFLGMEGAREGNQHFCGEHCSEDFQGYMEGGAETGAMVAAEILDDLMITLPPVLAGLLTQATDRPRGSYHAGFGEVMTLLDLRRP